MSVKKQTRKRKLTLKQQRFVDNYVANGGNATQAALMAGYSDKTAYNSGYQNMNKCEMVNAINNRIAELEGVRDLNKENILALLTRIASGEIVPGQELPPGYNEQLTAIDKISKIKGLFIDRASIEYTGAVPVILKDDLGKD